MLNLYAILGGRPRAMGAVAPFIEPLRVAVCGSLFAAVREMNERTSVAVEEHALRSHERTVRELAESVDAILPARFGSVFANEAELTRHLALREKELLRALELVAGREQMTLRVFGGEPEAEQDGERGDAAMTAPRVRDSQAPASGADYLLAKKRARDQDHMAIGLEQIHSRVAAFVRAERTVQRYNRVSSVFHLIDRGQSREYTEAVNANRAAAVNLRFTVSGPWPPYAFGPREII